MALFGYEVSLGISEYAGPFKQCLVMYENDSQLLKIFLWKLIIFNHYSIF